MLNSIPTTAPIIVKGSPEKKFITIIMTWTRNTHSGDQPGRQTDSVAQQHPQTPLSLSIILPL